MFSVFSAVRCIISAKELERSSISEMSSSRSIRRSRNRSCSSRSCARSCSMRLMAEKYGCWSNTESPPSLR